MEQVGFGWNFEVLVKVLGIYVEPIEEILLFWRRRLRLGVFGFATSNVRFEVRIEVIFF